jgi:hypothetical protein
MIKTARKEKENLSPETIRQKLKLKHFEAKRTLSERYPHVDKFFRKKGTDLGKIREHSAKLIGTGIVAGSLFLLPPMDDIKFLPSPHELVEKFVGDKDKVNEGKNFFLIDTLNSVLPKKPRPLTRSEEKFLEQIFKNVYGINSRATLEGEHLNTTFGYIGAEQHLRRFPGDVLSLHGEGSDLKEGMAPGLSAWGYFAPTREEFSEDLGEVEKWYAVVQTLYLPDWNVRQPYLKNWYKHRKVFIVDADNGKAVVAAIADSGPAAWTGKHYGGSPEVMNYLGGERYKKGKVIVFFVDDPENEVALGPVEPGEDFSSLLSGIN